MTNLQQLKLNNCALTQQSIDLVLDNLSKTKIAVLNLSKNDLSGCIHIGKFIKMSKTIEKLKLKQA